MHDYLKNEAFIRMYSDIINPIPEHVMWFDIGCQHPFPPIKKTHIGIPKKIRKKESSDATTGTKTKGFVLMCSYDRCIGHNKRSCKQSPN